MTTDEARAVYVVLSSHEQTDDTMIGLVTLDRELALAKAAEEAELMSAGMPFETLDNLAYTSTIRSWHDPDDVWDVWVEQHTLAVAPS